MANGYKRNSKVTYSLELDQEITCISTFSPGSFYLSLGVGILEIIAKFKSRMRLTRVLIGKINEKKEEIMAFAGINSSYIEHFYAIIKLLLEEAKSTSIALGWIAYYVEGDNNEYAYSVKLCTQFLVASLLHKDKKEMIELVMSGNSIKSIEFLLLNLIAETFEIQIILYRGDLKERYTKPRLGEYPILIMSVNQEEYSLLYSTPMMEIENEELFDLNRLERYPFLYNNRSDGTIRPILSNPNMQELERPKQPINSAHGIVTPILSDSTINELDRSRESSISSDYNTLSKIIITKFATELLKGDIPEDLIILVQQACSLNNELSGIEGIGLIEQSAIIRNYGMNTGMTCIRCSCTKSINLFTRFNCYRECKICSTCRKGSQVCINCNKLYTQEETQYLESIPSRK